MPRDDDYHEKVAKAQDTNTCFYCQQPILDGQGVYTINHSHYECHEKFYGGKVPQPFESISDLKKKLESLDRRINDLKTRKLK